MQWKGDDGELRPGDSTFYSIFSCSAGSHWCLSPHINWKTFANEGGKSERANARHIFVWGHAKHPPSPASIKKTTQHPHSNSFCSWWPSSMPGFPTEHEEALSKDPGLHPQHLLGPAYDPMAESSTAKCMNMVMVGEHFNCPLTKLLSFMLGPYCNPCFIGCKEKVTFWLKVLSELFWN